MTVSVACVYAHIQTLVSVIKMATMLGSIRLKSKSFLRFYEQNDSMEAILITKYFLFVVGSVSPVKLLTTGTRNSLKDLRNLLMIKRTCGSS
jgi:hypothetical protein